MKRVSFRFRYLRGAADGEGDAVHLGPLEIRDTPPNINNFKERQIAKNCQSPQRLSVWI